MLTIVIRIIKIKLKIYLFGGVSLQKSHKIFSTKVLLFFLAQLIFVMVLCIGLIYYGPFTNIRDMIVTTAMTSLNHKYIATLFLSKDEIDKILQKNATSISTESENLSNVKANLFNRTDNIQLQEIKADHFKGYLLIIQDPKKVGVGTAGTLGKTGETLSSIVKRYNAIGGVNAGGFADANFTGSGGKPMGVIIENGQYKYVQSDAGRYDIVGFNDKDVLVIGTGWTFDKIKENKIRDGISFGPPLVINGKPMIINGNGGWGINPRTAIGQRKDGAVLLLAVDGRQSGSIGATLKETQDILIKYGAYNAANLDGGSSTTMIYNGTLVNNPCDLMGERAIPSAFIIR